MTKLLGLWHRPLKSYFSGEMKYGSGQQPSPQYCPDDAVDQRLIQVNSKVVHVSIIPGYAEPMSSSSGCAW